jgi:cytochrome P450
MLFSFFDVFDRSSPHLANFYDPLLPWLGSSLLTSSGARWKAKRRLLTPAFHFRILQNYVAVNTEQTNTFLDIMYAFSAGRSRLMRQRVFFQLHASHFLTCTIFQGRTIAEGGVHRYSTPDRATDT